MQSGPCSSNRLEMASKRIKAIILKIGKMIMIWYLKELDIAYPQIISASREARDFCKKGKLIYIKKSTRWAQSGVCSSNCLETAKTTV